MSCSIQNKAKESYEQMLPWIPVSFLGKIIKGMRMNTHTQMHTCTPACTNTQLSLYGA